MDSLYVDGPRRRPPGRRDEGRDRDPGAQRSGSVRGADEADAGRLAALVRDARIWCEGRSALVRVPVVLYLAYVLVGHWGDLEFHSLLGGINFAIHEIGHIVFVPLGELLTIAGGTILQCAAPCVAAALFVRQRDYFAVAFAVAWLGTNLFHCATYCADARGQLNLVLYSPGGQAFGADGVGDWTRMLTTLGILTWDGAISSFLRLAASIAMLAGLALACWLLWQMRPRASA